MPGALGHDGAAEPETGGVAEVLDGGDLAQLFDDSGEHFPGPPASSGTDSGAVDGRQRTRARTLGANGAAAEDARAGVPADGGVHTGVCPPAAHCLPSGLSPSVQEFHLVNRPLEAAGSRTFTAGSDFHRPRSALLQVQGKCATPGRRPDR
ncbi:hypothetical protein GCM10018787_45470 [Streptomyces thermodiastaticus]|nr:hypothetical protein GCM10018787_45470 [Streptomyces thermodiastaticus]